MAKQNVRSGMVSGFTLVELLVVIGIIALLISILLPSLNKARQQAQTVACAANLHSLAQAVAIYQTQYRSLPPISQWSTGTSTPFSAGTCRGFIFWSLLGVQAGQRSAICPTAAAFESPTWPASANTTRALYSYRYNWLLSGCEANLTVAPNLPHARIRDAAGNYNPVPMKTVPNSADTLLFVCYPQLIAWETDDAIGTDRGIVWSSVKPAGAETVNGRSVQSIRGVAPMHGTLRQSKFLKNLSDGSPALDGLTNVAYADGSVRTVEVAQGQFTSSADPGNSYTLDDSTYNGNIRPGNECLIEGTRLDPTVAP